MTQVLAVGCFQCAGPYCAPSPAAGADSYALQQIWADALRQWRLPATHQADGAAMARSMTQAAYGQLPEVPPVLAQDVKELLARTTESLSRVCAGFPPLFPVSPIRLATLEDESVLVEWILSDRRVGFLLSNHQGESGWFFVYSAGSSERYEAGTMDQLDLDRMLRMMIR